MPEPPGMQEVSTHVRLYGINVPCCGWEAQPTGWAHGLCAAARPHDGCGGRATPEEGHVNDLR